MFTFHIYILNLYISFFILVLSLYSISVGLIIFLVCFVYYRDWNDILFQWVNFLNKYYHRYIVSNLRSNYILIFFKEKILLSSFTIFLVLSTHISELFHKFYLTSIIDKKVIKLTYFSISKVEFSFHNNTSLKFFFKNITIFYNFFKNVIVCVILSFFYSIYTIYFFQVQFLKQIAIWFIIGIIYYWLISGFNFFIKHYQFGKFTSQIQRFWKRTNTYFWLIEGFLILIFFYYFLNSSQEPLYMYDYSALNQEYLVSLTTIFINMVFLSFIIYLMYVFLLQLNFTSWSQQTVYLLIISFFIFFSFFIETYQFYYLLNSFSEKIWLFNEDLNTWVLSQEIPTMRCKHYYLMVYLVAKYWHFLFIFLSWVFFMSKNLEKKQINYVLLGANLQNIILLFILNISCYAQWLKWFYRRFYDLPYKWFFVSSYHNYTSIIFHEVNSLFYSLFNINMILTIYKNFIFKSLYLWHVDSLFFWTYV